MRSWQVALGPVLIAGQRRWDRHGADAGRRWAWQAGVPCVRRGWPRRHGCGRFGCGWPCAARGPVRERPGYVTIRGLDGFRGNAPRDAGKQVKGHQARAQGACRPSRGGTSRLSTPLEGGRRQARHLLPRPSSGTRSSPATARETSVTRRSSWPRVGLCSWCGSAGSRRAASSRPCASSCARSGGRRASGSVRLPAGRRRLRARARPSRNPSPHPSRVPTSPGPTAAPAS